MKVINLAVLLLAVCFITVTAQQKPSKIAGAYQWCPFPCETIKINDDFTFDYHLHGDLFNNERTKGKWKFVGANRIHLKSVVTKSKVIAGVNEAVENSGDEIRVTVADQHGAIIPGIIVSTTIGEKSFQFLTDENGGCVIPQTQSIEVSYKQISEKYLIKNTMASHILVVIDTSDEPYVDEEFIVENQKLCKLDEHGKTFENCYGKISKAQTRRLFPSAK